MDDLLAFGRWLKRCRQEQGLTQDDLAERVGCATETIRKIESGRRRPSYQMAQRLAQVLGLAPEEQALWVRAARETVELPSTSPESQAQEPRSQRPSLPAYLTPFVGREQEQTSLIAMLRSPSCRLVTLLGPGGIGKTRLAVEIAHHIDGFADGVAFVSLAAVGDPRATISAITDTLGVVAAGPDDRFEQLQRFLRERDVLLVLDNLEHLLDASGALVELLRQLLLKLPHLKLLVTSRERLKIQGEWVVEVEGLPVPPQDTAKAPTDYASFTLFLEHAQRVRPTFRLSQDDTRAIAKICRLVGGMPLGIELAAAWMMTLSCAEVAAELQRGLDFLELSNPSLPPRHRSMRVVFEHSWKLLDEHEQVLLARIAIFRSGFTREAATFVSRLTLPHLASLVQKSLVRVSRPQRYELHEVTQRFAAEQLARRPDSEQTHRRFFDYYLALSAEASHNFADHGDRHGYDALVMEIDNLRFALQQAIRRGQAEQGARLTTALRVFWVLHSLYREGIAWSERLLELGGLSDAARGDLLTTISYLARSIGEFERARSTAEDALLAQRRSDDMEGLAWALGNLAQILVTSGEYERARELHGECVALRRTFSGPHTIAWGLIMLTVTELLLHNRAGAQQQHAETLAITRSIGDRFTMGGAHNYYALGLTLLGDWAGATEAAAAYELLSEPEYPWGMIIALEVLAAQAGMRGEHQAGGWLAGAAQQLRLQHQIAATAIYRGDYERLSALARGSLDEQEWAQALNKGARLTRAELLALARHM
jgi:predicted ATPase/transcriptional regulator with XRE-family HTH domain